MGKYLKKFENHSDYETYINGSDVALPNVSLCKQLNEVHYNPIETRLVAKYNVTSTSEPTILCYSTSNFSEMEIDGVVLPSVVSSYIFDTTGEHTIKYTFTDVVPKTISERNFIGCSNLTSVIIPEGVTSIGSDAFYTCTNLTSVIIPNSVRTISMSAFALCSNLSSISIGNGVTSIGYLTFTKCSSLTSITIPNSVTTIGEHAFSDCTGLTSIIIPNSVTSIGGNAFGGCISLTSATIPNSVTTFGSSPFRNCTNLTSVIVDNDSLLSGNRNMDYYFGAQVEEYIIGSSVTAISASAFNSNRVRSVTIGDNVTSIGNGAFDSCTNLENIISLATAAPAIQAYTFYGIKSSGTLTVPSGSSGYDVWMGTGDYYLGKYSWTKVEQ